MTTLHERSLTDRPERCPNCATALQDRYCPHCGQNNRFERLSAASMAAAMCEELLELDLPIVRTVKGMTLRPGPTAREYVEGHRRRYTNPVRYCIIAGALMVLIFAVLDISPGRTMSRAWGVDPATRAPRNQIEAMINQRSAEVGAQIEGSMNIFTLIGLPFLAVAYWRAFHRSGYTYAEHLSYVLFAYSHILLFGIIGGFIGLYDSAWGFLAMWLIDLAYLIWAAWGFYRRPLWFVVPVVVGLQLLQIVIQGGLGVIGTVYLFVWPFVIG